MSKGSGLVRAYYLRAAKSFNCGQSANDGVSFAHVCNADRQYNSHDRYQAFWYGGNSQRDRDHESAEYDLPGKSALADDADYEYDGANCQNKYGQHFAQLIEFNLKWSLAFLGAGQGVGDLAHLSVHTGSGNHRTATAIDHGAAHIDHVLAVAQRHIGGFAQVDNVHKFTDRYAFSSQCCLLNLHTGVSNDSAVRRDCISRFQQNHITYHQVFILYGDRLTIPQHCCSRSRNLRQRFNGLFSLVFLINSQNSVDHDYKKDDYDIRNFAVAGVKGYPS